MAVMTSGNTFSEGKIVSIANYMNLVTKISVVKVKANDFKHSEKA